MPKPAKSSASSGTRKKQAQKAAKRTGGLDEPDLPRPAKGKKARKAEKAAPRVKVFIPPVKPSAPRPDPLESRGIASQLPPELVVVLRSLGKKDTTTKIKGLEELQAQWIDRAASNEEVLSATETMMPVWYHHYPALVLNRSRRIRSAATALHSSLWGLPSIGAAIRYYLSDVADVAEHELIVGAWALSSFDIEATVAIRARGSWEAYVASTESKADYLSAVVSFLQQAIMTPAALHLQINPPAPEAVPPPIRGTKKPLAGRSVNQGARPPAQESEKRQDIDEEAEGDQNARYRVGGLGTLRWLLEQYPPRDDEDVPDPLGSVFQMMGDGSFWSTLFHGPTAPWVDSSTVSFGFNQPLVRRSAWNLLPPLVNQWKKQTQSCLPIMGTAVLRSAWVEPATTVHPSIWEPLLRFLSAWPSSWFVHAPSQSTANDNSDSDDGSDAGEDGKPSVSAPPSELAVTQAYKEFLGFLELGCNGSPALGYPIVMLVVSSLPSEILSLEMPDLTQLFGSLWAAVDSRIVGSGSKSPGTNAFLSSLLDTLVYLGARLHKAQKTDTATTLIEDQFSELWLAVQTGRLQTEAGKTGVRLGQSVSKLGEFNVAYVEAALKVTVEKVSKFVFNLDLDLQGQRIALHELDIIDSAQQELGNSESNPPVQRLLDFIDHDVVTWAAGRIEESLPSGTGLTDYLCMLVTRTLGHSQRRPIALESMQWLDQALSTHLDSLVATATPPILINLLIAYATLRPEKQRELWDRTITSLMSPNNFGTKSSALLSVTLSGVKAGRFVLPPDLNCMETLVDTLVDTVIRDSSESESSVSVLEELLTLPNVMTHELYQRSMQTLFTTIVDYVRQVLRAAAANAPTALWRTSQIITKGIDESQERVFDVPDASEALSYALAYVLSENREAYEGNQSGTQASRQILEAVRRLTPANKALVGESLLRISRESINDTTVFLRPKSIIQLLTSPFNPLLSDRTDLPLVDSLFTPSVLDGLYLGSAVGFVEGPLLLLNPELRQPPIPETSFDLMGFSSYARSISALTQLFDADHELVAQRPHLLKHLILVEAQADDFLHDQEEENSTFSYQASAGAVKKLHQRIRNILTYSVSSLASGTSPGWHADLCRQLREASSKGTENLAASLAESYFAAIRNENSDVKDVRVFRRMLHLILRAGDIGPSEVDPWLMVAQSQLTKAPQTAISVLLSVSQLGVEVPRLDRLRSEIASNLSGVPPDRASTDGIRLVRQLVAVAPAADSDAALLPQQRAVFLLQALQKWIASDESMEDDMDALLLAVCYHLAPVVQSIPGAHWDFIFDLIESNLEAASVMDKATFTTLTRGLDLVLKVEELSQSNKSFRSLWTERRPTIVSLVADLLVESQAHVRRIETRRDVTLQLLRCVTGLDIPIPEEKGFPALCDLLLTASMEMQVLIHGKLSELVSKYNERLVVETAMDSEGTRTYVLPDAVMNMLLWAIYPEPTDDNPKEDATLAFLIAWTIGLEFFENISVKLKNAYLDCIKKSELVEKQLIPGILGLLRIEPGRKGFAIEGWAVDEFYLSMLDDSLPTRFSVFAAHVYFRSLGTIPSLVRSWLQGRRDRKLSEALSSYTSKWFTPVIVSRELSRLKDTDVSEELVDERLTIKVAAAIREVTAIYSVDDQPMEMGIAFPADFPLHNVSVREGQKLGIPEVKWRAWLLNVQLVAQQTGSVVDALALWKRNISLHFEGEQECAICYSVISVTDRTLPKKPCLTCNNKFHASCLYKWFNTSHNSTCPLCRSNIL